MKIFSENPNLDVAYETTDGNFFATRNSAENHAKTLKEKTVKKHVRPDAKNVNVLDADDPEVAAIALIQTGEKEDGTPDLKQVLAKVEDTGKTTVQTVPVPAADTKKEKTVKKHVRPDAKNVNVLDADDPEVAAIALIQTGEKEDGTPDLKQVLAKVEDTDSGVKTAETPKEGAKPAAAKPTAAKVSTAKTTTKTTK